MSDATASKKDERSCRNRAIVRRRLTFAFYSFRLATVTFWKDGFTVHEPRPTDSKQRKKRVGMVKSFKDISSELGDGPLANLRETLRGNYEAPEHKAFLDCMNKSEVTPAAETTLFCAVQLLHFNVTF